MSDYDVTIPANSLRARTMAASTTPAPLASDPTRVYKGVVVKNLDESIDVYVGGANVSSTEGYTLTTGESTPLLEVKDAATIYVVAASGTPSITWIGL